MASTGILSTSTSHPQAQPRHRSPPFKPCQWPPPQVTAHPRSTNLSTPKAVLHNGPPASTLPGPTSTPSKPGPSEQGDPSHTPMPMDWLAQWYPVAFAK